MGIIIDSEAHPWIRLPANWRHRTSPDEKRSPLGSRAAANFKPARPAADGSFPPPEETAAELLALMDLFDISQSVIYPGAVHVSKQQRVAGVNGAWLIGSVYRLRQIRRRAASLFASKHDSQAAC